MSSPDPGLSLTADPFRPLDVAERALSTAWQAFIISVPVNLAVAGGDERQAVVLAALAAGIGAAFSAIRAAVAQRARTGRVVLNPIRNVAERLFWTALAAATAAVPSAVELTGDFWAGAGHAAYIAAGAALLSAAKNLGAEGTVAQAVLRAGGPTTATTGR